METTTDGARIYPGQDGLEYCEHGWHVVLLGIFDDPAFFGGNEELFDFLAAVDIRFVLDGVPLDAERTSIRRFSNPPAEFSEQAFAVGFGAFLPPGALGGQPSAADVHPRSGVRRLRLHGRLQRRFLLMTGRRVREEQEMKRQSAGHTKRRRNPRVTLAIALGAGFLVLGGVALATPGVGILSAPVHARGTLAKHQVVNSKSGIHLKTKGSVDVATQQIPRDRWRRLDGLAQPPRAQFW